MSAKSPRLWLVKSEPGEFSFQDLLDSPAKRTHWDGIRNYQVRNFIRDDIKQGDLVLYYHSNAKPPGVIGIAEVVKEAYADHTQFDPKSKKFDPKSDQASPTWLMFDLKAKKQLKHFVGLADLKANKKLAKMLVVQRGQRLSIQPVSQADWDEVLRMGTAPKHAAR